jgi:von Willebrand factor type D domain
MCGDGLTEQTVCSNSGSKNNGQYIPKSMGDCSAMIAAINSGNPFTAKCPNNRSISHYVVYNGCNSSNGQKYESGKQETCSCPSGKCGPSSCGGAVGGDPHFRTHDGTLYSFHGECDLVMARSPSFDNGLGLDVHARTQIIGGTWSLVSNAAVRIGSDIFELKNDGSYYVNGVVGAILPTQLVNKYNLHYSEEIVNDGLNSIRAWYTIELNNGEKIEITNYKSMISINVGAVLLDTVGMLGSSVKAGLVGRDGETLIVDPDEMGSHWQVNAEEPMLFHDIRAPQYPETCILPEVSKTHRRLRSNGNDNNYAMAKTACTGVASNLYDFCVHDVMISGDTSLAKAFTGGVF